MNDSKLNRFKPKTQDCKYCGTTIYWKKNVFIDSLGTRISGAYYSLDHRLHRCRSEFFAGLRTSSAAQALNISYDKPKDLVNYWPVFRNDLADLIMGRRVYLEKFYEGRKIWLILELK